MNFVEAIKAMQEGKICFRKLDPDIFFKIEDVISKRKDVNGN